MHLKISIIILILIQPILSLHLVAQSKELKPFEILIGGKWGHEGIQLGGHQGKTEYHFSKGLDGKIIKVKTFTTDPKTKTFELRNEGIRAWNATDSLIYFYEFDKNGGFTTGKVSFEDKDINYDYNYHGTSVRDSWEYIDDNTFGLIIGIWDGKIWKKKFHEAIYTRIP